ncbi:hypothetical protein GH714_019207 [Hevea brasiliensis]|uniref:DYW domain-containing protein n=1 Tax=Hevea brasiliensis TaxID=3981 RepID=A0A6A6K7E9_HEVBR|nr:hypothetical protein GH714_019207 [Hevea brasiliensis]
MCSRFCWRQFHSGCIRAQEAQQKLINNPQSLKLTNPIPNSYPSKKELSRKHKPSKNEFETTTGSDIVKLNMAITTHMRNGQCESALRVFNSMPSRSTVSYNAMISGYLLNGKFDLAREMFDKMPHRDFFSWNVMLSGYVRNKNLTAARALFEKMPKRDIVSWNAMLSGYAQNGIDDARRLFESKLDWDIVSWNCLMGGFLRRKRLADARRLFDKIPVKDEVSWNTMITGYAQNGELEEAQRLFEESPSRDVFTWTAMVSGFVQNGMLDKARSIFDRMPEKNSISWNAMIAGYVQCKMLDMANELFEAMPCRNISSWNTMITGYSQSGEVARARNLFDRMPLRDSISWSAMIAGYVQNGYSEEAVHLSVEMRRDGEKLNRSSFTCALTACANIAALELGKQLHGWLVKSGYQTGCFVGNALLAMYCKCGSIDEAHDAFQELSDKDLISWNTMIYGYARHGFGREALMVFESMKTMGVKPDDATMVELGAWMRPKILMRNMPFEPDAATWGAVLGASRIHGNTELGEKAAEIIFKMEPDNSGMYILLSNLYAASGRWPDVSKMRLKMRDKGVKKVPGYSWLEVQTKIHTFTVGDCFHPEKDKIYAFLEEMYMKMKHEGFILYKNGFT